MRFNFNLEDIKYIKLLYKDSDGSPCTVKAAIKRINEKEIMACAKFEDGLTIETPQEITLSIICNDGLYRTKTKLIEIENDEPYTFFTLETPQGLEYQQNREYFRVSANFDCVYFITAPEGIREYRAKTYDISANGVSIILASHIISAGDSKLDMLIEGRIIEAQIRYVRGERVENGYKISFTYTKIAESDRDYISQVCIKKQLEQRRNAIH